MSQPRPATDVADKLDAVLDELRAIRVAIEGGIQPIDPRFTSRLPGLDTGPQPVDGMGPS